MHQSNFALSFLVYYPKLQVCSKDFFFTHFLLTLLLLILMSRAFSLTAIYKDIGFFHL